MRYTASKGIKMSFSPRKKGKDKKAGAAKGYTEKEA